mmetsp:Transcript_45451/g.92903  ORF Transcript_45451/g.92903 Transcript_45451/m.92903 type:complete len:392 (-) Transcript_45451:141-1316(-)
MQSKRRRGLLWERRVNVLEDVLGVARVRGRLESGEDLKPLEKFVMHVRCEVVGHQAAVVVVRHVPTVHDLPKDVPQIIPRHLGVRLEIVHRDLGAADEITEVEGVHAVPALRPKLLALDHDGMEEAERKRDALELAGLGAALEEVVSEGQPILAHVRPEPVWRLVGKLHTHLQDVDGKLRGLRRQEHAEVGVRAVKVVTALLEVPSGPTGCEMNILQEHPPSALERHLDRLLCHRLLPLPQRHEPEVALVEADSVNFAELLRVLDGIHARREDEEHRRLRRDVAVRALQVEGLRRHVLGAHDGLDKGGHGLTHAVGAEGADEEQTLEVSKLLPVSGERLLLGALELEPLSEALGGAHHVVWQLLKDLKLFERVTHEPRGVVEPLIKHVVNA